MNKKRDCFATLAMTGRGKRSFAFTLSEVLIVLAVLGVVAAMTIPDLIQDAKEKALITALKKNYTVFSQAVDMAVAENGPMKDWDIGGGGAQPYNIKFYNYFKPYLRIEKDCGNSNGCFADNYKALDNQANVELGPLRIESAKGVLTSGTSFAFQWNSRGCLSNYYTTDGYYFCGYIIVDVNGKASPNRSGVDLFYFIITSEDVVLPAGFSEGQKLFGREVYCIYNSSSSNNGMGCAYWAIQHENMDYLRKAGNYYGNH